METDTIDIFSEILPPEVTHAILSFLSPIDIVNASQVSKTFAGLLDSRGIWKRIVEEQFGPLNEEIFKGNIINWKKAYSRGVEFLKFKKYYLASQALPHDFKNTPGVSHGSLPTRVSSINQDGLIFYRDRAMKKPYARLYYYCPPELRSTTKVVGFSTDYALIFLGDKLRLWNLTIDCKHTDDHKWKSSPNKEEICKKGCSFVRDTPLADRTSAKFYWCDINHWTLYMTAEGIRIIDLNTGQESMCNIPFEKYGAKLAVGGRGSRGEKIVEVRVMPVNGVSMTFCHVQSINGDFFVNLTTKRVHLFVDKSCMWIWIPKSLKVAVMNAQGLQMRVVSIAEEQPKILAKFSFTLPMKGVLSSPEGHALFVWHHGAVPYWGPVSFKFCAYLWEVGYTLGELSLTCNYNPYYQRRIPLCSYLETNVVTGKHSLVLKDIGDLDFNTKMKF